MNFELKTLSLAQAAAAPCDALVLLWPDQAQAPMGEPLAELAAREAAGLPPDERPLEVLLRAFVHGDRVPEDLLAALG